VERSLQLAQFQVTQIQTKAKKKKDKMNNIIFESWCRYFPLGKMKGEDCCWAIT
jgi:hypothetical protein